MEFGYCIECEAYLGDERKDVMNGQCKECLALYMATRDHGKTKPISKPVEDERFDPEPDRCEACGIMMARPGVCNLCALSNEEY